MSSPTPATPASHSKINGPAFRRSKAVLALCEHHKLTVYDAAYLELAQRKGLPLATLDSALSKAAFSEQVALIAPA